MYIDRNHSFKPRIMYNFLLVKKSTIDIINPTMDGGFLKSFPNISNSGEVGHELAMQIRGIKKLYISYIKGPIISLKLRKQVRFFIHFYQ